VYFSENFGQAPQRKSFAYFVWGRQEKRKVAKKQIEGMKK
tara:strand:+ start:144 stop:263 length:120 start_codon:yes stop_codon:yes gene_type:complete